MSTQENQAALDVIVNAYSPITDSLLIKPEQIANVEVTPTPSQKTNSKVTVTLTNGTKSSYNYDRENLAKAIQSVFGTDPAIGTVTELTPATVSAILKTGGFTIGESEIAIRKLWADDLIQLIATKHCIRFAGTAVVKLGEATTAPENPEPDPGEGDGGDEGELPEVPNLERSWAFTGPETFLLTTADNLNPTDGYVIAPNVTYSCVVDDTARTINVNLGGTHPDNVSELGLNLPIYIGDESFAAMVAEKITTSPDDVVLSVMGTELTANMVNSYYPVNNGRHMMAIPLNTQAMTITSTVSTDSMATSITAYTMIINTTIEFEAPPVPEFNILSLESNSLIPPNLTGLVTDLGNQYTLAANNLTYDRVVDGDNITVTISGSADAVEGLPNLLIDAFDPGYIQELRAIEHSANVMRVNRRVDGTTEHAFSMTAVQLIDMPYNELKLNVLDGTNVYVIDFSTDQYVTKKEIILTIISSITVTEPVVASMSITPDLPAEADFYLNDLNTRPSATNVESVTYSRVVDQDANTITVNIAGEVKVAGDGSENIIMPMFLGDAAFYNYVKELAVSAPSTEVIRMKGEDGYLVSFTAGEAMNVWDSALGRLVVNYSIYSTRNMSDVYRMSYNGFTTDELAYTLVLNNTVTRQYV